MTAKTNSSRPALPPAGQLLTREQLDELGAGPIWKTPRGQIQEEFFDWAAIDFFLVLSSREIAMDVSASPTPGLRGISEVCAIVPTSKTLVYFDIFRYDNDDDE